MRSLPQLLQSKSHLSLTRLSTFLLAILVAHATAANAGSFTASGPSTFLRGRGGPTTLTSSFSILNPDVPYELLVENGGTNGEFPPATQVTVTLNGKILPTRDAFAQRHQQIFLPVQLKTQNILTIVMNGRPGSGFALTILGTDNDPPNISFTSPRSNEVVTTGSQEISIIFDDLISGIDLASLSLSVQGINVTSETVVAQSSASFTPATPFAPGAVQAEATISDHAGNSQHAELEFFVANGLPLAPELDPYLTLTTEDHITISGAAVGATVLETSTHAEALRVPIAGQRFSVSVPLLNNSINRLVFTGLGANDERGPAITALITRDNQPPSVFIDMPVRDTEVYTEHIDVAGRIGDILSGFQGLTVTVNGVAALVDVGIGTNGSFLATDVPLIVGDNTILAAGRDALGNQNVASIHITRLELPPSAARMEIVSGLRQAAQVRTLLPEPLVVRVLKGDGSPFPDKIVNFEVARSDGRLSIDGLGTGALMLQSRTDENGFAAARWKVGSDAGCGNNRVQVSSLDIAGSYTFCASATPAPAAQINVGSGNNQKAESGSSPPLPLQAWVSDGCNGIEGVPVTFTVTKGSGRVDGASSVTIPTSATGHAAVTFTLGPEPGNQRVEAALQDVPDQVATFSVVGTSRISGEPTRLDGLVMDNARRPIGGAICQVVIEGLVISEVESDLRGQFHFTDLPGGPARLHVNGLAATRLDGDVVPPGSFPDLGYDIILVPNGENALPMPVLLPGLNPHNAKAYSTTEDIELTVEEIQGLKMTVTGGSMRLPDGTPAPSGTIIALNQVHHDAVPMPMPDGVASPFAWTLQPAGAHFDPPVRIQYPNMTGLPAGALSYFLSFNHETNRFEIIGSGTVSADGSQIVGDTGVGISAAGWGCNCPPYSVTGSCSNCDTQGGGLFAEEECDPCEQALRDMQTNYARAQGTPGAGFAHQLECLAEHTCGANPPPCPQSPGWSQDRDIRDTIENYTRNFANNPFQSRCQAIPTWLSDKVVQGTSIGKFLNSNDLCALAAGLLYHFPFELLPAFARNCPMDPMAHDCFLDNSMSQCFTEVQEFSPLMKTLAAPTVGLLARGLRGATNFLCPAFRFFGVAHSPGAVTPRSEMAEIRALAVQLTESPFDTLNTLRVDGVPGDILLAGTAVQLQVFRPNPDGSETDVTQSSTGTLYYLPETEEDAHISPDGFLTLLKPKSPLAAVPGTLRVIVANQDDFAFKQFAVMDQDADGDAIGGTYELAVGLDPAVPNRPESDLDGDELNDLVECVLGTPPLEPDADNDGLSDGCEVAQGSDPLDPASRTGMLPSGSMVSVGGQAISTDANGAFSVQNIAAADVFGPGGPGSPPDFKSDEAVQVLATFERLGKTVYAVSEPFSLRQGLTTIVRGLDFHCTPPPLPVSLRLSVDQVTLTLVGQAAQISATATLGDGSSLDVSPASSWTTYRTSNPGIATVDENGLVNAVSAGVFFITATNGGASAAIRMVVAPGDPLTSLEGFVQRLDGTPVVGASLTVIALPFSSTSDAEGRFTITGVPTQLTNPIVVTASFADSDSIYVGQGSAVPIPGGVTDLGIITVRGVRAAIDPQLGTLLPLNIDDGSVPQDFSAGFTFPFFGQLYTRTYIGSNGYVTFGFGDAEYVPSVASINNGPRIAAYFTDLDGRGGAIPTPESGVYFKQLPDRAVITWYRMGEYAVGGQDNTAQIILFSDGRIQLGYAGLTTIGASHNIGVGVSPGGEPASRLVDFSEDSPLSGSSSEAIIEIFTAASPVDLDMGFILFGPNPLGGYDVQFLHAPPPLGRATVSGKATDADGDPVGHVELRAVGSTTPGTTHVIHTSSDGTFRLENIPVSGLLSIQGLAPNGDRLTGCVRPVQPNRRYLVELGVPTTAPKDKRPSSPSLDISGEAALLSNVPLTTLTLEATSPNPVRNNARVRFGLPKQGRAKLSVFNAAGRLMATLLDQEMDAGWHYWTWDVRGRHGDRLAPGVYFMRLEAAGTSTDRKLLVIR